MRYTITICLLLVLLCVGVSAQEVPLFEIADNYAIGMPPIYQERWSCSVADIDRNGWPDIFNTKWYGDNPSQLYLNNNGIFSEISDQSPDLLPIEQVGARVSRTPVFVDFDNDEGLIDKMLDKL